MRGQTWRVASSVLPLLLLLVPACGDDGIPDGPFEDPIEPTDGEGSSGDGSDPDGADETGGGPDAVEGTQCLFDPIDGLYGYRYQCQGSVAIDILIEHSFEGSPVTSFLALDFGQGVEGDSYEDPLVMACCPWYETGPYARNCDQPHERACLIDLIEQGCKSMVGKLEDFAYDAFPGLLDAAKRRAVLKIAEHVRTHQDDCTAVFRDATGIAITAPQCDAEDNGRPYLSMLEDGMWSFDPAGPVTNVELAVAQATWTGVHPVDDDGAVTEQCDSADYNDGVLFLEVDPAPSAKVLHVASGSIRLQGPKTEGFAELGSTSVLALLPSAGPASLENLALHSAGVAFVTIGDVVIPVDAFHVRLWDRAPAIAGTNGESLIIRPGGARFAVSASILGESRVRTATNTTPIVITKQSRDWRTSAFSIGYAIGEEQWTLVIEAARWQ